MDCGLALFVVLGLLVGFDFVICLVLGLVWWCCWYSCSLCPRLISMHCEFVILRWFLLFRCMFDLLIVLDITIRSGVSFDVCLHFCLNFV